MFGTIAKANMKTFEFQMVAQKSEPFKIGTEVYRPKTELDQYSNPHCNGQFWMLKSQICVTMGCQICVTSLNGWAFTWTPSS